MNAPSSTGAIDMPATVPISRPIPPARDDLERAYILVDADCVKLRHYLDVPGAIERLLEREQRLKAVEAELQAAGWDPLASEEIAEIYLRQHPEERRAPCIATS